jgi:hypothetical protein
MYKKFLKHSVVLLSLMMQAGCIATFHPPVNGPVAQLAARKSSPVDIALYEDAIECTGGPRVLYSLFSKTKGTFVIIPANKPLTIRVVTSGDERVQTAYGILTFIPEAGKKYAVGSSPVNNTSSYRMQVWNVIDLKNGNSRYIPIRYIKREEGFWYGCSDNQMKEIIRRISTSYQKD